jgi:enediyne polyketide synthase
MSRRRPIAIVGMACRYPDARSPLELWENVLAQRQSFRRIPRERLRYEDYYSPDRTSCDHVYTFQAAVIEGYEFDRRRFNISGSTYRSVDLSHWLALDIAAAALEDAGFPDGRDLPRQSTGVLVGNTLTGEFSRANLLRTRWPYVRRNVEQGLVAEKWEPARRVKFLDQLEQSFKAPFPRGNEETLAGALSNTIAGRICNYFDLKGGGYVVDGACASSLLSVAQACSMLDAGDLDLALAGGVDLSIDPFELVGFARAGALAEQTMRVFDTRSAGFLPGEGCGFVTLMRLDDAERQGRKIHAVIRGWGISSDGAGGMTRPEIAGQALALKRAYDGLDFGVADVGYFECHGTGTAVGDTTELQALSAARRDAGGAGWPAAVGSVKAIIGHTKAAAGVAGIIKTVMALRHRVIPPTAGCEQPHAAITAPESSLRVLSQPVEWPAASGRRAGVSSFGFGGINCHLAIEAAETEPSDNPDAESKADHSAMEGFATQDCELFLFDADDFNALRSSVEQVKSFALRLSRAELSDLAAALASKLAARWARAAIVADSPATLADRLGALSQWLAEPFRARHDPARGLFLGATDKPPRIAFLCPGQGSNITLDGGAVARRFATARLLYAGLRDADPDSPAVVQPAVVRASIAAIGVLRELGIDADVALGHSLGELTALHWAGAFDQAAALELAAARGRIIAEHSTPGGAMASIGAAREAVESLRNGERVAIACHNGPRQTVISGLSTEVEAVVARAKSRSISAAVFRTTHAFHSPLVSAAAEPFRQLVESVGTRPMRRRMISTITGDLLTDAREIPKLLGRQMTSPVRFAEAIKTAAVDVDLFVEVGAGEVLSRLVANCSDLPAVSGNVGANSLAGLLNVVGAAFSLGLNVNHERLFSDRFVRLFQLDWKPRFFANPCESAPVGTSDSQSTGDSRVAVNSGGLEGAEPVSSEPTARTPAIESPLDALRHVIAEQAELAPSSILADSHLLRDLHLNSIKVAEIVALTCRRLGLPLPLAPTEMATATVAQIAEALSDQQRTGAAAPAAEDTPFPSGIDTWVRGFKIIWVKRALPTIRASSDRARNAWQLFAKEECALRPSLKTALSKAVPQGGVVLCLPPMPDESCIAMMLAAARAVLSGGEKRCVIVHHGRGGAALGKTLFLESPNTTVCCVDVPADAPAAVDWIAAEARAIEGFVEVRYDRAGARRIPVVESISTPLSSAALPGPLPLDATDVLLVTGGGKGIAAECALALARETGAKLIILGRSVEADDAALAANLARLRKHGVRFDYRSTDVTDVEAVQTAIREAQVDVGLVTAILHGAGTNVPMLLSSLTETGFLATLRPKVDGLKNVLASIDTSRLRRLITFGSIIAQTGFRGEADYAVSNEWLGRLVDDIQESHPNCRCLNLEWSIWSGVGMGHRLGSITPLLAQGITPISPDDGARMLMALLRDPEARGSIVVSGRFGNPPTLEVNLPWPAMRFLQTRRSFYPQVELIAECSVGMETEPYLADHVYRGRCLLPGVVGMEMMVEAAMAVTGWTLTPQMENIRFERPIEIPPEGQIALRILSLVREDGRVETVLRSEATRFAVDHFIAVCRKSESAVVPPIPDLPSDPSAGTILNPGTDLYGPLLFHGPAFQRVRGYALLRARECVAEISPPGLQPPLGDPTQWRLGDPIRRDAAIHAIQACIPHKTVLPTELRQVHIFDTRPGPCRVIARETSSDPTGFVYDVWMVSEDQSLLEHWSGLRLQVAEDRTLASPLPISLLQPYAQRRVVELLPDAGIEIAFDATGIARVPAIRSRKSAEHHRPDGKPDVASDGSHLSRTHFNGVSIACTAPLPVGVDAQSIGERTDENWGTLLGPDRMAVARLLRESRGESMARAATRIWSAGECLVKLSVPRDAPLTLGQVHADGWTMLHSGRITLATFVILLREIDAEICLAFAAGTVEPKSFDSSQEVGFDEINRMGTVNFTTYFHWQARAREAFLRAFAPSVLRDLHGGAVLVTTAAACEYKADIIPDREVIVRMKLGEIGAFNLTMNFDYLQIRDGVEVLVASGRQTIASMHRVGGKLVAAPLPPALRTALAQFATPRAAIIER